MPNMVSGPIEDGERPRLRFEGVTMVRIDSHNDMSRAERNSYYYGHSDMQSFVQVELQRRKAKGITSMSALAPDAEKVGELDDEDGPVTF